MVMMRCMPGCCLWPRDGLHLKYAFQGSPVPQGWDSPAFCSNLQLANCGRGLALSQEQANRVRGVAQANDNRGGLQSRVYKTLMSFEQGHWVRLLLKRFDSLCPDEPRPEAFSSELADLRRLLRGSSQSDDRAAALAVIKTVTNAWATTDRFHEDTLWPCIFGCDDDDALSHYLVCDPLWTICACSLNCRVDVLQRPAAERLCLVVPTPLSIQLCGTAYWVYHTMKLRHREEVERAVSAGCFTWNAELAFNLLLACPFRLAGRSSNS